MNAFDLIVGCYAYEVTEALFDGTVSIEGVNATMATKGTLPEIFKGLIEDREFDVAELGLTFYLRALEQDSAFIALPIFPNRMFRHSSIFVNASTGIERPEDLVDKTIGEFGIWGQDSSVWSKGVLMDEHGFDLTRNRWLIGGLEQLSKRSTPPFDFVPRPQPTDVDITRLPEDKALGPMLETGEIDALFTANVPQCVLDGSPKVRRLFVDYEATERDWYHRTGIFPIMHAVAMPRALANDHPGVTRAVFRAFVNAKDAAADTYRQGQRLFQVQRMLPWTNALVERDQDLLGEDWWPYGIAANRKAIETYLRYHHEQGMSSKQWTIEEIFTPELLDT